MWENAQNNLLDQNIKEALDFISAIMEKLKQFDMPDVEYKIPRIVLLALIKRTQEYAHDKESGNNANNVIKMSPTDFEDCKRIGQFALNVYSASWAWNNEAKDVATKMGLSSNDEILFTWFADKEGQKHCPKFMLFVEKETKSIVLAIRGTYSLADVIVDVVCDEDQFLDGFAHRGILQGGQRILEESGSILKQALQEHPGYRLVVTGHSLGAGTAILIAMSLLSRQNLDIVDPNQTEIKCVALAPPPVYRARNSSPYQDHINIFINGNDIVPRLSLANLAKLLAMCRAVDQIDLKIQDHLKILAGLRDPEILEDLETLANAVARVKQDQFPSLEHPGKIFYLKRLGNSKTFKLLTEPGSFFSTNLLLFENMVLDHLQPYYEEAFANVEL